MFMIVILHMSQTFIPSNGRMLEQIRRTAVAVMSEGGDEAPRDA